MLLVPCSHKAVVSSCESDSEPVASFWPSSSTHVEDNRNSGLTLGVIHPAQTSCSNPTLETNF